MLAGIRHQAPFFTSLRRRSRVGARWEWRSEERQQAEPHSTFVGDAQFFIAPIEGNGTRPEGDRAAVGFQNSLALHGEEHQIGGAMAVRREGLAGAKSDDPDVALRALDEWLCHQSISVVSGGVVQLDDVHQSSIARRDPMLRRYPLRWGYSDQLRAMHAAEPVLWQRRRKDAKGKCNGYGLARGTPMR